MGIEGGKEIFINLIHYPVRTLGIGQRIGIWVQGCSIHCNGCIADYTWERDPACRMTIREVLEAVVAYQDFAPDGITVSGGEPFDQPESLLELLKKLRTARFKDIMLYSGYKFSHLKKRYKGILDLIDVLVDGPFMKGKETRAVWKGSENQRMIILTQDKGLKERYLEYMAGTSGKRSLQVVEKKGNIYVIGIPQQKDVEVMKRGFR